MAYCVKCGKMDGENTQFYTYKNGEKQICVKMFNNAHR